MPPLLDVFWACFRKVKCFPIRHGRKNAEKKSDSLTTNPPSPSGVLLGCGQVGVILGATPFVKEVTVIQRTMAALGKKRKENTGEECVDCQRLNSCHHLDFAEVV